MYEYLVRNKFPFKASSPMVAMNESLRTLQKQGLVHKVAKIDGVRNLWELGSIDLQEVLKQRAAR